MVLNHHPFSKSSFDFFELPLDHLYMFTLVFNNHPIFISRLSHFPLFIEYSLHLPILNTKQLFQPRFISQQLLHPRIDSCELDPVPLFTLLQPLQQSLYVYLHLLLHPDMCPALSLQLLHYYFIFFLGEHNAWGGPAVMGESGWDAAGGVLEGLLLLKGLS